MIQWEDSCSSNSSMKYSLFLLSIGIVLEVDSINQNSATFIQDAFRGRREYVYKYDAQVVTGMEPFTAVHSGLRLSAIARVQFTTYTKIRVLLDNIVFYRLNKPVVQYQADSNILPEQVLSDLRGADINKMVESLRVPFGFEYVRGHVIRIILSDKENVWSANAKRGFISLFEVNLEKRMLMEQYSQGQSTGVNGQALDNYQVMEKAPTGDCATTYTVKSELPDNHLFVLKVRDFDVCLERPIFFKSMFQGYETPQHKKGAKVLMTKKTIPHVVRGKHKKDEQLHMTLYNKFVDPQDPFEQSGEEGKRVSSAYDVYPMDGIIGQLTLAAENTHNMTSQESLVHLGALISMLKLSPMETPKNPEQDLSSSRERPPDRLNDKIFWNVIPHVGTCAAANFILDVCIYNEALWANCSTALNVLTLKVTPTAKIIKKLVKLIETLSQSKTRPDKLKQASYLTLGSLAYKLSVEKQKKMDEIKQTEKILDVIILGRDDNRFVRRYLAQKRREVRKKKSDIIRIHADTTGLIVEFIKRLIEPGSQEDKILGLKSLGNAGQIGSLSILSQILNNRKEPMINRILAITGHRRMYVDDAARKQAIDTLLGVYQNTKETSDIRITAFSILFSLWPEKAVLTGIAQSLNYEKDTHVSHYVLSLLSSLANSSYSVFSELSKNSSDALQFAPPNYETGYYHSFYKSVSKMFPDYKTGLSFNMKSIGSKSKYEGWAFSLDTYIYGLHSNFLEIGIHSEGLDQLLSKLSGSGSLLTFSKAVLDLLKRSPRSARSHFTIDKIFKTLNIKPRTASLPEAHIYYKMMGHELGYFDLNDLLGVIPSIDKFPIDVKSGKLNIALPIQREGMWYLHDTQLTLPSEAGLPISLKLQLSTSVKNNGHVSADVLSYLSPNPKIGFNVDLQPKVVASLYGSMGLDSYILKPAIAFRGLFKQAIPIKKEAIIDLHSGKFKFTKSLPQTNKPITEVLIEPFGEFQVFSTNDKKLAVSIERIPIFASTGIKFTPVNTFYISNFLGYKFSIEGQLPSGLRTPICPYRGRTVLNLWMTPLKQAARKITINGQIVLPTSEPRHILPIRGKVKESFPEADKGNDSTTKDVKVGRPLRSFLEDSLLISEPADPEDKTMSMRQLVAKMEKVSGKVLPSAASYRDKLTGLVISVDASSDQVSRKSQVKVLWADVFSKGTNNIAMFHLWRSPIVGYDDKPWELLSSLETIYPLNQYKSQDVLSVQWQQQLMKDLQYLVGTKSHRKSINKVMNRTLLSTLEHLNYPAMTKVPAFRVVSSLVPQVLYKLVNQTNSTHSQRNWLKYWKMVGLLSSKVEEERKLILDPHFINRDAILISYFQDLLEVQQTLLEDLASMTQLSRISHAELPVMQWVVLSQERLVYMLDEIVERDTNLHYHNYHHYHYHPYHTIIMTITSTTTTTTTTTTIIIIITIITIVTTLSPSPSSPFNTTGYRTLIYNSELMILRLLKVFFTRKYLHISTTGHNSKRRFAIQNGAIKKVRYIGRQLQQSKTSLTTIMKRVSAVISSVESLSQEIDTDDGQDVVIISPFTPKADKQHSNSRSDHTTSRQLMDEAEKGYNLGTLFGFGSNPDYEKLRPTQVKVQGENISDDIRKLIQSLYQLTAFQTQVIEEVQVALGTGKFVDPMHIITLMRVIQETLSLFDANWKIQPLKLEIIKERMLM
ncbi:vitellogenin, partial [Plakobranchus ocellatus]